MTAHTDTSSKLSKGRLLKRWLIALVGCIIVIGALLGTWYHHLQKMIHKFSQPQPPITVTAAFAQTENWTPKLPAVGSTEAINGVNVAPQVSGQVTAIDFTSGQEVQKNQILAQLDTSTLLPQLDRAEASLALSQINYQRQLELSHSNANSASDLDNARATLQQDQASVAQLKATLAQMTIRAPFSGKMGIRLINLGQYLQAGTPIGSLQSIDPLYVNFDIPSNDVPQLTLNQTVEVHTRAYPNETFTGKITAMDSMINPNTRSLSIQATVPNPNHLLLPGMFVTIEVVLPEHKQVTLVPETAVNYTLYGNSVYVIQKDAKNPSQTPTVHEVPVTIGTTLHDHTQILSGLQAGDEVVTTGQMKLYNKARVEVVPQP